MLQENKTVEKSLLKNLDLRPFCRNCDSIFLHVVDELLKMFTHSHTSCIIRASSRVTLIVMFFNFSPFFYLPPRAVPLTRACGGQLNVRQRVRGLWRVTKHLCTPSAWNARTHHPRDIDVRQSSQCRPT